MEKEIESFYPKIGQGFNDILPSFEEAWLRVEMIDDVSSSGCFYRTQNESVIFYKNNGLEEIESEFRKMREEFITSEKQPFTQATFWLSENGKFSIEFGYEDVSDFGMSGERREAWIKTHLGENVKINWGE